jgi:hypothetical protein
VVALSRTVPGAGRATSTVTAAAVRRRLDPDTVVAQYAAVDGMLYAVLSGHGRSRLLSLAPLAEAAAASRRASFGLGRVLSGFGTPAGVAAAWDAVIAAADRLDQILVRPLGSALGDRALVVSPVSGLGEVPWSLLPSCRGRPVSVAPSLGAWCRGRSGTAPRRSRALAVAGPGLPGAVTEVASVASCYPRATSLVGDRAAVGPVLAGLSECDVAHLATHGNLRPDNPLLSTLELSDGPLTGYDLERLEASPHTVVLPACHGGRGRAAVGDETLGLASTLLAGGVAEVVAPIAVVPDDASIRLMAQVHRRLADGARAAAALADAQAAGGDVVDPHAAATAGAFVTFVA